MQHLHAQMVRATIGAVAALVALSAAAQGAAAVPGATPLSAAAQCTCGSLPKMATGFRVETYARVTQPMKLSFSRDGSLYVGRQGGNDRIHRIGPHGRGVIEFGPPQSDPDAVLADDAGRISGHRHSVLVGGGGVLAAIYRSGVSAVIFNSGFADVDDMKFDRDGRLIFSDDAPRVLASSGGPPVQLFATPSRPGSIAIDEDNRIFVALADGTIRIYRPDGSAVGIFASGLASGLNTYVAFGEDEERFGSSDKDEGERANGGGTGRPRHSLYVLSGSTLLRFNRSGKGTVIGTGFPVGPASGTGFVFGPDKALYVSDYQGDRVLRVARRH